MASAIEIVNSALITLGANTITSFDEDSQEAKVSGIKYPIARASELRRHPWNFAIKRQELARSTALPVFRYKYKYTLPSDCIRVMTVYEDTDYKLEANNIYTDKKECLVKYIFDNEDTATWDPMFVDVMSARLALDLAYTLPAAKGMVELTASIYETRAQMARSIDGSEDIADPFAQYDNALINTRFENG